MIFRQNKAIIAFMILISFVSILDAKTNQIAIYKSEKLAIPLLLAILLLLVIIVISIFVVYALIKRNKRQLASVSQEMMKERNDEFFWKQMNFLTNISHEFRTPLTLILSPLESILSDESENNVAIIRQKVRIVYKNASRLNHLVDELLDIHKIGLNSIKMEKKYLDIVEFTESVITFFEDESYQQHIGVLFESEVKQLVIRFDPKILEKILFNLLSRAFKVSQANEEIIVKLSFTNTPGKSVTLASNRKPADYSYLSIAIQDSGKNLPDEQSQKIFIDEDLKHETSQDFYGSGEIALTIARKFTEIHEGIFHIANNDDKGSLISVLIPLDITTEKSHEFYGQRTDNLIVNKDIEETNRETDINKDEKIRVLLVEDNFDLRKYLKDELRKKYKVLEASDGEEGLAMATSHLPDIIVSDVIMPGIDGFEMCKKLKTDFKTSDIPIILLTAKNRIEDHITGAEIGAEAYLPKPFNMRLLQARMHQLLESRKKIFEKFLGSTKTSAENLTLNTLDKDFLHSAIKYIRDNMSNPELTVEMLAEQLASSRSQVYRKIKSLTGQSANEMIRKIRLDMAKKLLQEENMNVNEICYQVGFSSPSYFTKCFKEEFGESPSNYLKKGKQSGE